VWFFSIDTLIRYRDAFVKEIVKTPTLTHRIRQLQEMHGLSRRGYVCIHLRCGDRHIVSGGHCHDERMGAEESVISPGVEAALDFLRDYHLPICLITDNVVMRAHLKEKYQLLIFDTTVNHLAVPDQGTETGCLDTVAEFFLLGESAVNVMLTFSGFPIWSSFIYNVPLFEYQKDGTVKPYSYILEY